MQDTQLPRISNFIWSIADDVLRDLYVRGKYRDVILPMLVLRRLDTVLVDTKPAVMEQKRLLDAADITEQDAPLQAAAGHNFWNASPFTLSDLTAAATPQKLRADFEAYLDGFSPDVQDILDKFQFRQQIGRLSDADALGTLITRFLSPDINLSPKPVLNADESERLPGLDNHAMGSVFEDLVRRFNEENNEEAGEHWTPRDAVELMARLVFEPVADSLRGTTYTLYDGAIGTGGMLTLAEETLHDLAEKRGLRVSTHLFGQEINSETYAICKADLLLKGAGASVENIVGGPEYSTLSNDAFADRTFDFMLSNPPYGKSWKSDLDKLGGKRYGYDPRFIVSHEDEPELSLLTRTSDGQLLFLVNMLQKMKTTTTLRSRIAEVHNGSSLFTGDAGSGESNIRRWIIENDWLEAVVALPLNMFYNTGIATYIWILANNKLQHRQGYVQLIDASEWHTPLRKNLGSKNCELSQADIQRVIQTFIAFEETPQSTILPNAAFGYLRAQVDHPLRLPGIDPERAYKPAEIRRIMAEREPAPDAPPVIRRIRKDIAPDPIAGLFARQIGGEQVVVEYEPDLDMRDIEQAPLLSEDGVEGFMRRSILPYAPDAWHVPKTVKLGYEINFNRYFYKSDRLRTRSHISGDLSAFGREGEALLAGFVPR